MYVCIIKAPVSLSTTCSRENIMSVIIYNVMDVWEGVLDVPLLVITIFVLKCCSLDFSKVGHVLGAVIPVCLGRYLMYRIQR
jgi:hypothetical protein